jgi:hypothetical protein
VPEDDEAFLMNVDDDEEIDRMQQDAQEENIYTNRRGHNMKRETSMQKQSERKEQDDPPGSEDEGSLNISESNDSMHELKKVTAIPILKNNDKFKMNSKEAP